MLPSGFSTAWQEAEVRRTLPVTVAGPRRILTGFPPPTVGGVYRRGGAFAVPYPATVLAVAAVILAGSAAGVLAARRRSNATAIADSMLSVSLWAILPVVTFFNFARFEPSAEVGRGPRVRVPRPGDRAGRSRGRWRAVRCASRDTPAAPSCARRFTPTRASSAFPSQPPCSGATRCRRRSPTTSSCPRRGCWWSHSRSGPPIATSGTPASAACGRS